MSQDRFRIRSPILYALLCAPLALLLVECGRGAYCDYYLIRTTALQRELSFLRFETLRQATRLEMTVQASGEKVAATDWSDPWIQAHWEPSPLPLHQTYAAVVDPSGRIVLHTDRAVVGSQLEAEWYQESVPDGGLGVVRLRNSPLSGAATAYDARVPIVVNGRRVGEYHQGLDGQWFDSDVWKRQRDVMIRWSWLFGLALVVDAAAAGALIGLMRRQKSLRKSLKEAAREWAERISKISWGLAHEIRNPLHTLRINVYTLRRSFAGNSKLGSQDLVTTLSQSDHAVDTLESLTRDLLQYTTPASNAPAEISVVGEIRATLNLMSDEMKRKRVEIRAHFPAEPVHVAIDPGRMRQLLLNVLTFAQNNAGPGGAIDIEVRRNGRTVAIEVLDSGSPLTDSEQDRIFDPFQSIRETGSGLGLALVKHFAEDAGGSATCHRGEAAGCRFRILLPLFAGRLEG